jgi:hypothetical protein
LHAERVLLFDAKLFELIHCADDLGIVERISQAAEGDDRVHHRRINRAQPIAHLEAFQHPFLRSFQRNRAQRPHVDALKPVHHPVDDKKEIPP